MFQFPRFPPMRYGFTHGCIGSSYAGLPIQRSSARWSCAPPRGLSQLITSFIGSQCQGIRPAPFLFDRPCPPVASGGRLAFPAAGWPPAARLFLLLDVFPISHSRSLHPSSGYGRCAGYISYMQFSRYAAGCTLISHPDARSSMYLDRWWASIPISLFYPGGHLLSHATAQYHRPPGP